ncbi:RNA polymerase sigma-70 factor [Muricauda sp. SCSIO 64092]|uniref:RNA polymerase sigma factor n=1 Tax=Allomuricauda sp. SCSIO 64092 TaxID=2908842 RepID=UPI001FF16499|nr:RNA polymerase sigma-70 factor [Muricauda sp. SCSIO 64092]UOY08332.1 RNA polymerase sigma-70 factor [Muricauda sp. SCSIO 64092]
MTDVQLKRNLKLGHKVAYKFLFEEYYNWLCNYLFKLSGNRSLSKDLVQEVMIKFYEGRHKINVETNLKSYLFTMCHNHFLNHIRRNKNRPDLLDRIQWTAIYESYFEVKVEDDSFERSLNSLENLLNTLPPKCREIFILNKLEKRKYKEIARDMEISIKTVESQMSRALRIIREKASCLLI